MRSYEETSIKANNMSADDILNAHNLTREGLRHYFSRLCCSHSEEDPYELDIDTEDTMGLSESEKIKYLSCCEQEGEGIIYFKVGGIFDETPMEYEFDEMKTDELIYIVMELEGIDFYDE